MARTRAFFLVGALIGVLSTGSGFFLGLGLTTGALPPIPRRDILAAPSVPLDSRIFLAVPKANPFTPPLAPAAKVPATFAGVIVALRAALVALPGLAAFTALACLICGPTLDTRG